MALGLGSLGTSAGFFTAAKMAEAQYRQNTPDTVSQRAVANTRIRVANIALIAFGAIWALNVVDAYLSGYEATEISLPEHGAAASTFGWSW